MALLAEMEAAHTRRFLKGLFAAYYRQAKPELPPRFSRREWGFIPFGDKGMVRHQAFGTRAQLEGYLRSTVPAHAYHNVAYFRNPAAAKMADKGWQGADLIFDLDADKFHEEGQPFDFAALMERTRHETVRLLDEFLLGELALDPATISLYFSGGRGYHIHVRDPKLLTLGSGQRREIVDYITATGLDTDRLLVDRLVGLRRFKRRTHAQVEAELPPADAPGWAGRLTRSVENMVKRMAALPAEEVLELLQAVKGLGAKKARQVQNLLAESTDVRYLWSRLPGPLCELWLEQAVAEGRGHTDEPVTTDIHRLIRLPGSLHGGTGLAVVSIALDSLGEFDPYEEAVVLPDTPTRIRATARPGKVKLKGEDFSLQPGEVADLPAYAAAYCCCRGWATMVLGGNHSEVSLVERSD